jgi:hypothetical protein
VSGGGKYFSDREAAGRLGKLQLLADLELVQGADAQPHDRSRLL